SPTASAQQQDPTNEIKQEEGGLSPVVAPESTSRSDPDAELYLDADEVEKRAVAERSDPTLAPESSRIPLSFRHLAVPLPGGVDHVVAGVGTRNTGGGVIR